MRRAALLAWAILLLASFACGARAEIPGPDIGDASDRAQVWDQARGRVEELLRRREASDFTDDWKRLHGDGGWFGKSSAELADAAVDVLASSKLRGIRGQLRDLDEDAQRHRQAIEGDRLKGATLPDHDRGIGGVLPRISGGLVSPDSKDGYDRLIAGEEAAIKDDEAKAGVLRQAFAAELQKAGVTLTPGQIDGLLSLSSGDDLTDAIELFANLSAINQALAQATVQSSEDVETAKKYYGIYAVLVDTALYSQVKFVHKVDDQWLPRIDAITAETNRVAAETARLMAKADPAARPVLKANQEAQALTLRAAKIYRGDLLEQRRSAAEAARKLWNQRNVALNTYKTVATSVDLVGLMRSSNGQFQQLLKMEIPPLRPFESQQMKLEFEKLSHRLDKVS